MTPNAQPNTPEAGAVEWPPRGVFPAPREQISLESAVRDMRFYAERLCVDKPAKYEVLQSSDSQGDRRLSDVCLVVLDALHALQQENAGLRAAVKALHRPECQWQYVDLDWSDCDFKGSCGIAWSLNDGGLAGNGLVFCPKCGGRVLPPSVAIDAAASAGRAGA